MEQSQYYHFLSRAQDGAEAVVLLVGDHDLIGCFTDQVKLTCALVQDLDEAVKEVKLLCEHEDKSNQKITELEALCKKYTKDAQKVSDEKATLDGMVESHDELIMEIADEIGFNCMGEDAEDDDDGGDTVTPPAIAPSCVPAPPAAAREVIVIEEEDHVEMVPEQEAPKTHEVILVDAKAKPPQPCLYSVLMRDHEESPSRMMDDLDDLNGRTKADYDVNEWFLEDGSNDQD
jgi:hypothetical protein